MTGVIHIVVAMKPLEGNFAENAVKHGVAGLNIDGTRVETKGVPRAMGGKSGVHDISVVLGNGGLKKRVERSDDLLGRWPANIIHDGSIGVVDVIDYMSGLSGGKKRIEKNSGRKDEGQYRIKPTLGTIKDFGDKGGASRFFKQCGELKW